MDNNHNNKFKKYEALRKLSHSGNKGYGEDSGSAKKTQTHLYIQLMWFCKYVLCTIMLKSECMTCVFMLKGNQPFLAMFSMVHVFMVCSWKKWEKMET